MLNQRAPRTPAVIALPAVSVRCAATVDFHGDPRDHACFVGAQESRGVAHVFRLEKRPIEVDRNLARISGVSCPMKVFRAALAGDGIDGVDPDAGGGSTARRASP